MPSEKLEMFSDGLKSVFFMDTVADGIEKTAQDVDVFGLRVGASEQALHTAHQALAVAAVEKPMSFITLSMWATIAFDLLVGRGVVFLLQMGHGRNRFG